MIYAYKCEGCGEECEIIKSLSELERDERCVCGSRLQRYISAGRGVHGDSFRAGYHHAFGKSFSSSWELKDHLRELRYEHGREVIEVGNEKVRGVREKPSFESSEAKKELRQRWRNS